MVADIKLLDQKEPRSGSSDYFSDSSKAVPHSDKVSHGWGRPYMAEDPRK
jgi:hypothetical protein